MVAKWTFSIVNKCKTIRNIISCNQEPLSYLFAGLCICGSGNVFDNTTVAVMVVFYIIFALKALIFN